MATLGLGKAATEHMPHGSLGKIRPCPAAAEKPMVHVWRMCGGGGLDMQQWPCPHTHLPPGADAAWSARVSREEGDTLWTPVYSTWLRLELRP